MPEDEGGDFLKLLNESVEESLAAYIKSKVQVRMKELDERKRKITEELAGIDCELDLLKRYCAGHTQEPSVQDLLAKLLKK